MKLLAPEFTHDREQIALLKHEASVGRELDHPHVLRSIEFAANARHVYVVMELFKHPNIKQRVQQGGDDWRDILPKVLEQAADGLAYFNEQGWVHRDVKPDNYLVDDQGTVKLIDFALAQKPKGRLARLLPGKAKIQGTRSYMSPEQIRGEALDARTDVYSFGCMLYELLASKPPYSGETPDDLLNRHLRAQIPSVQAANNDVSDDAAALVRSMIAKQPAGRPQSMREVTLALKKLLLFR